MQTHEPEEWRRERQSDGTYLEVADDGRTRPAGSTLPGYRPPTPPRPVVATTGWFTATAAVVAGSALIVFGVIFGFTSTSIENQDSGLTRLSCGSLFAPSDHDLDPVDPSLSLSLTPAEVALCDARRDARLTLSWGPILAGTILAISASTGLVRQRRT